MQETKRGESASLRCRAVGNQPLQVIWSKDKTPLDLKGSAARYDHYESKTDLGINSELLIRTTERTDGGVYTCQSKNEHGQQERSIKLSIVEVPEAPQDVRVVKVWSKSATFSWTAPYAGNSQVNYR